MATGLTPPTERRRTPRVCPTRTRWRDIALLRPGQEVVVINLSERGALLESPGRMAPGARAQLQLFGPPRRLVHGRIDRCQVATLDPLCYRGAVIFDEALELWAARGE